VRLYDCVSVEPLLYRRLRQRLGELLGPIPGATVVEVGCGTGLNLGWLHDAVSPGGRVIGVDASESMLSAARRRTRRHG
jgi:ubiquinone/menaquinone biosynthesis C-methylase UbiE